MNTISVIIPTYKNRGGLSNSIDSVLSQNCSALAEVIVVDDNSPNSEGRENTEKIMGPYASNPLVKYIKHPTNKNGSAARNTGFRASTSNIIAFLDDDDIFLPGKLEKQLSFLETNPDMDAVYCFREKDGRVLSSTYIDKEQIRTILLLQSNFQTSCLMFRRKALEAINGFDESFVRFQDLELMLRFFSRGLKLGCVQEVLVEMGKNEGENIPKGEKLDNMKKMFFQKFDSFIKEEDCKTPGFANKVYSKHYAGIFLAHVRNKDINRALNAFLKSFFKSPIEFIRVINNSIIIHLTGKA